MTDQRSVAVGDRDYTIRPLNGRRAILAGKLLTQVVREGGDLVREYVKFTAEYRKQNVEEVSPALFEFRARLRERAQRDALDGVIRKDNPEWSDAEVEVEIERLFRAEPRVPIEDWERSGNVMAMAGEPGPAEVAALIVPQLFEAGEERIGQLLALMVASNSEVRKARLDGNIDGFLNEKAEEILDEADLGQITELLSASLDVIQNEVQGKLVPLRSKFRSILGGQGQETEEETTTEDGTSSDSTASTDSPPPTDGPKSEPSTKPPGLTSTVSSNA